MSSSSSSSDSRSDSDDDEITKQRKKDKFRAKVMRRQKRSELENIEEEKKREIRLQQMKHKIMLLPEVLKMRGIICHRPFKLGKNKMRRRLLKNGDK